MPELPEVEVSRRGIEPHLVGQVIQHIDVRQPHLRWPIPEAVHLATEQRITGVRRRAKYLLIDTAPGSLILHLGMSGALRVLPISAPLLKHDHLCIELASGQSLRLNDPRRFGAVLWQAAGTQSRVLQHLGPEPLTEAFGGERLYRLSRHRKIAVKNFIMDNAVVVGVGNIYATEALFSVGIDPRRGAGRISQQRYNDLAEAIKVVLSKAILQGGTSLRDFTQADGKPGYFKQALQVYGRANQPCVQCHQPLKSTVIGQRTSVYCSHCQR